MTVTDELRNSPPARFLGVVRSTIHALATRGWSVREAAAHSGGIADVVATRRWQRPRLSADVRLILHAHSGGDGVFVSATESVAESLPSFCYAEIRALDDTLGAPARIAPPSMRVKAATFRADDPTFAHVAEAAFSSTAALYDDLFAHEADVYDTDDATYAEAGIARPDATAPHVTLLHPIVVTNAKLWVLGDRDRLTSRDAVRLLRTRAASGERKWIDVVHAGAVDAYVESVTRHYVNAMKKRRLVA